MTRKQFIANVLSEISPITAFVVLSESRDFESGLAGLLVFSFASLIFSWFVEKRVPKFGLFAAGIIFFFGLLSIILDDPFYIIIKDTLFYASFAMALIIGELLHRPPFKLFFHEFFAISERGWRTLALRWALFFIILTVGNEIARHHLTAENWVIYKLIALTATWVFGFYQFTLTRSERLPEANQWGMRMRKNEKFF